MSQNQQVRGVKTAVFTEAGVTRVVYRGTCVVAFALDGSTITLNTGGWKTTTTKLRMNQASNQYGLGYGVYQKDHAWFVTWNGQTISFDGDLLTLKR